MVLVNLGAALIAADVEKARQCFAKAVMVDNDNLMANYNLGVSLRLLGKNVEAIKYFQKALEIDPEFTTVYKELYIQTREMCDWKQADKIAKQMKKLTDRALANKSLPDETPFASMLKDENPKRNYQVASAWSRYIKDKISPFYDAKNKLGPAGNPFRFGKKKSKKIRIGYLSADFKNHATAHLIMGLLKLHDRQKFNIFIYSYGLNDHSLYRQETEKAAGQFTDIINLADFESAKLIYQDKVDILVDLKGHTGGSRFEIPALRPAPVQVNYLGFPGTSGADFIDYFITDKIVTPAKDIPFYSEKLVFLPYCYQVNDNQQPISSNVYRKADFGLPINDFVFCSFNMTYKINPKIFDSWMRILKAVPNSILWLLEKTGQDKINLKKEAKNRGVDPSRLVFSTGIRKEQHLARLKLADLCLDTFTCNGMTTTSDSLWAGVPVITLKGKHFASRVSASLLTAIGLPELITHSPQEYEDLAIKLAKNPKQLDAIRYKLNANRLTKPLFDTEKFTRYLEEAYSKMWQTYTEGKKPTNIVVNP
jgi:protein O-GlcNAc transferase